MSSLTSAVGPARAGRPHVRLSHLGDELLARQAARGSERAFAAIYERYHQQLYRYCRSIVHDEADAQDALQSTFASALQALKRDSRSAPLRPWLYRIAHNEAISLLRRRRRDATEELDAETPRTGCSVEQQAADRARWVRLIADLRRLPERQRGALLLRELSGLSHDEIAIALGTSTGGAKQAIFEARQALNALEEGRSMSCEEARRRISEGDRRVLRGRSVSAHLRACAACEAFAVAIPARQAELRALTPALPPAIATAVLARSLGASSTQGGATGAATAGAGAAGKAAGVAMAWKAAAGVALIAATAAGVSGLRHSHRSHQTPAPVARIRAAQVAQPASSHAAVVSSRGAATVSSAVARGEPAHPNARSRHRARARSGAAGLASSPSQTQPRPAHGARVSEQSRPTGNDHTSAGHGHTQTGNGHTPTGPEGNGAGGHVGRTAGSVVSTASSGVEATGSGVNSATSAAVNVVSSVASSATSATSSVVNTVTSATPPVVNTVTSATPPVVNTVTTAVPVTAPAVNTVTNVVKTLVPPVTGGGGAHPPPGQH